MSQGNALVVCDVRSIAGFMTERSIQLLLLIVFPQTLHKNGTDALRPNISANFGTPPPKVIPPLQDAFRPPHPTIGLLPTNEQLRSPNHPSAALVHNRYVLTGHETGQNAKFGHALDRVTEIPPPVVIPVS